jgi:hypothetical protein
MHGDTTPYTNLEDRLDLNEGARVCNGFPIVYSTFHRANKRRFKLLYPARREGPLSWSYEYGTETTVGIS